MVKMTPEQEAEYALGFGVARSDLPRAAQEAYDRLVEQRTSGGTRGRRLRIWADRPVASPTAPTPGRSCAEAHKTPSSSCSTTT
jgi:hypothetical protein